MLVAVRPAALAVALWGGRLEWREWVAAAWFGPKGFASVVFGLLVLNSGLARADELFHLAAIVIVGSILAHSSTDVLVALVQIRTPGTREHTAAPGRCPVKGPPTAQIRPPA